MAKRRITAREKAEDTGGFDARQQHPHSRDSRRFAHDDIPSDWEPPLPDEDEDDDFFSDDEPAPRQSERMTIKASPRSQSTSTPTGRTKARFQSDDNDIPIKVTVKPAPEAAEDEDTVPFPANLFGLPLEEYLEKKEWYDNVSWGITISLVMSSLALIIAFFF